MIFTRFMRLAFRSVLLFVFSLLAFSSGPAFQQSASAQLQVFECVLEANVVQNGVRKRIDVGRLDLVLRPDSVTGQFSAEYQSGGGTYRFSGSFGNGKYGTKLQGNRFGEIKILEDKERKNGFAASGQYTATFEPASSQSGSKPEIRHHTCTFEISGNKEPRWGGLIKSDPAIDEGTPHPRKPCPGHIYLHFWFKGPTPLVTRTQPEPAPQLACPIESELALLTEAGKAVTDVVGYRMARKLGINSPACARITWDDAGITRTIGIQRLAPDASDLGKIDRGTALALKKHVAEDRVLAMLLGDPDRNSGNFVVTAKAEAYTVAMEEL